MRITSNMLSDTALANLNLNMEKLDKLQNELTSGQRIIKPSDDPIGAAAAVEFKGTLSEIDQYIKNVDSGNSWLGATDSALSGIGDILQRARQLAVQGASDTLTNTDRQGMADEVEQLLESAIQTGNSTYSGQYLFAGFKTTTAPFSTMGNPPAFVTYAGDSGKIMRQIDNGASVDINVTGDGALSQVFTTLINLRDALTSGDSSTVSARIADLDNSIDAVASARSAVGARMNRLDIQKNNLQNLKVNVTDLLSKTEDTDLTQAISDFALQQNVYKAALAASAKSIQPSLMDYLTG